MEGEIRAAMIEAEVRDEVMKEFQERMMEMEEQFVKNLALEVCLHLHPLLNRKKGHIFFASVR